METAINAKTERLKGGLLPAFFHYLIHQLAGSDHL